MGRMKTYSVPGLTLDRDGIVAAANPAAGTPMTLLVTTLSPPREVCVYSAANQSALSFVVVGKDRWGNSITETIAGPNNSTVQGKKVFATLTSITPSGTDGNNTEVGWIARVPSPWVMCGLGIGRDAVETARVSALTTTSGDGIVEVTYSHPMDIVGEEAQIDETITLTPGTPVDAKGTMCRVVTTTNSGADLTARFRQTGPAH